MRLMDADRDTGMQIEGAPSGRDRLGLALVIVGSALAVCAALLLWQAQGAAIFLSATVSALANCF